MGDKEKTWQIASWVYKKIYDKVAMVLKIVGEEFN